MNLKNQWSWSILLAAAAALISGCERPPVNTTQLGFRGLGMVAVSNPRNIAAQASINQFPVVPPLPAGGPAASATYKNVKVLGDLNVGEFTGLMVAMAAWVSPVQGCNYCHVEGDTASDAKYAKVVSRRMLQMTQKINQDWKSHVAATGVTCYTCHRGQPVPANVWFNNPGPRTAKGPAGGRAGQNVPLMTVGYTSLPYDPLTTFLEQANDIRITPTTALPSGSNPKSIVQTEATYALMMNLSRSLGVNCTFCHNTQSFPSWAMSPPQRATAWQGIRLVRDLNRDFLNPLKPAYPAERLGPLGDAPKVGCATCHQGANKPLYGATALKDYPVLATTGRHGTLNP